MLKNTISRFRLISYIEGISYLVLLFIAMPMKYILLQPLAVKFVGMAHGVLFIIFIIALAQCIQKCSFSIKFSIKLFILSLIPFGSFIIEKEINKIEVKNKNK